MSTWQRWSLRWVQGEASRNAQLQPYICCRFKESASVQLQRSCLHKETSKACARRTADSATTTWHIIVGQYRKSSISEYSNIRGLFGTNIRSQILVFVPALAGREAWGGLGPGYKNDQACATFVGYYAIVTIRLCQGMTGPCLIKIRDILALCWSNFKILSGALCCFICCITFQMFGDHCAGDWGHHEEPSTAQSASITRNSTGTSASVIRNAIKDFIITWTHQLVRMYVSCCSVKSLIKKASIIMKAYCNN